MTKEAEELHTLITSSHNALEEDRTQSARDADEPSSGDRGLFRNWYALVTTAGVRVPYFVALLVMMLIAIGLALFAGDDASAPSSESDDAATEADQDGSATPDAAAASDVPEFVDAGGATPLNGTWVMYWRNAEGSENPAFTLQFNGVNGGSVDVLNDETESDTWIEFDGDELRFGFTRTFDAPEKWPEGTPFPAGGWEEKSEFVGTRVSDGQYLGNWYRDDWECRPDRTPPCSTGPDPSFFTSWIEQEP